MYKNNNLHDLGKKKEKLLITNNVFFLNKIKVNKAKEKKSECSMKSELSENTQHKYSLKSPSIKPRGPQAAPPPPL